MALTCVICYRDYGDQSPSRRPLVISCGHTFCASCLSRLRDDRCPVCRSSAAAVPAPNYALLDVMASVSVSAEASASTLGGADTCSAAAAADRPTSASTAATSVIWAGACAWVWVRGGGGGCRSQQEMASHLVMCAFARR